MAYFKRLRELFDTQDENVIIAGNRNILLPICVWPGGQKPSYTVVITSIIICASHYFLLIPLTHYLVFYSESFIDFLECVCPYISMIITHLKVIHVIIQRSKLRNILNGLQEEWIENSKSECDKTISLMAETKLYCSKITFWYTFGFAIICSNYACRPLLEYAFYFILKTLPDDYTMPLPYKQHHIYDTSTLASFCFTYLGDLIVVIVLALAIFGLDLLFFNVAIHLTMHFTILNNKIDELKDTIESKEGRHNIAREFAKCIRRHTICIEYLDRIEESYNFFLLIIFMSNSVIICVVCFQMSVIFGANLSTVTLITYLFGMLAQLFFFSWISENLLSETSRIQHSIYNIPWYLCEPKHQRPIVLIIMRSQFKNTVTAGKFYTVELNTFMRICSTSYSYFTLLSTMIEK